MLDKTTLDNLHDPGYSLTTFEESVEILDASGECVATFYGSMRVADAKLFLLIPRLRDALAALLRDTGDGVFAASGSEARAAAAVLLLAEVGGK